MKLRKSRENNGERGATLVGYTVVVAALVSSGLGAAGALQTSSSEFLDNTGQAIGAPRDGKEHLANVVFSTPENWTPPSSESTTTTSTTEPTSSTAPSGGGDTTTTTTEATTTTTEATTTTTEPPPTGAFPEGEMQIAMGGCINVVQNGWLQRNGWCGGWGNARKMEGTLNNDGTVTLRASANDRCFGRSGIYVDTFPCDGSDSQKWIGIQVGGYIMYQNVETGDCLDFSGSFDPGWGEHSACDSSDTGQLFTVPG